MFSSLYDQNAMIALLRVHLTPVIGMKAVRQIVRAIEKPMGWFNRTVIEPALFKPDFSGGTYIPAAIDAQTPGRNHRIAEAIATDDPDLRGFKGELLRGVTLFANALYVAEPELRDGVEVFRAPKDRVVLDDHHVFTFEFDVASPAFLVEQLSWLRSSRTRSTARCEPSRVFWRLQLLRGWSHDEANSSFFA